MSEKKNPFNPVDREVGTAQDVEEMMKKYDRESNVRIWTGVPKAVLRYIGVAFSIYCILVTLFGTMMPEHRHAREHKVVLRQMLARIVPFD